MSTFCASDETNLYLNQINNNRLARFKLNNTEDLVNVLHNLQQVTTISELKSIEAELLLSILQDLLNRYKLTIDDEKKDTSFKGKALFLFLSSMGIIYNICNGFVSSASILTLFVGIPGWLIIVVGLILSIICIVLFLGIEMAIISKYQKIGYYEDDTILDLLVAQAKILELLIPAIEDEIMRESIDSEIIDHSMSMLFKALGEQESRLANIKSLYLEELKSPNIQILKKILPLAADIIFFSYGFFSGQAMAYLVGSALFGPTISVASLPIVVASILTGLMALILFCAGDRIRIENSVSIFLGLDLNKIDCLPSRDKSPSVELRYRYFTQKKTIFLYEELNSQQEIHNLLT